MPYRKTVKDILNILKAYAVWYETFEHGPVKTSEEAAKVRPGYTLRQGAKALIVKAYNSKTDGKFVQLIMPANLKLDSKKAATALGVKTIRFATQEESDSLTDKIEFGAIPPFGNLFGLEVFCDPKLFNNEKIVFNAGDRCFSIAMMSGDWQKIVNPKITELT